MPPPGLLRLAGWLESKGQVVSLRDLAYEQAVGNLGQGDEIADAAAELLIQAGEFDAVGISVMGATLPIALAIAGRLRSRTPGIPIALGGPGVLGVEAEVLERFPAIDVIVRGEGEETTLAWLKTLQAGSSCEGVAGISWRDAAGVLHHEAARKAINDLGTLADYAWHLLAPLEAYKEVTGEAEGLVPIDSGRGCVYDCSFCTIGRYWARRSRPLPAPRLADEVRAVAAMPAGKQAYLCHDLFGADREHALAFCDEMVAGDVLVPWECRARIDHLDSELLERMAGAGCYRVLLGIESAAPAVRRRNAKGMKDEIDLISALDGCARVGIVPILSLILGLPGEEDAELRQSLDFCMDAALRAGVNVSLHLVNPQPGCGLGEEFGADSKAVAGIAPDMAVGTGMTAPERELIDAHPDIFTTYALLPLPEERIRELARLATELPPILMRTPRSFALAARRRSMDCLDLVRDTWAQPRSLDQMLHETGDALIDEVLRWEEAQLRVAEGEGTSAGGSARIEWIETAFDLGAVRDALTGSQPLPTRNDTSLHFAV
ncbi:MAG: radical SAM superfamily enzyme YgiQ (UPF0313 family), partial [Planctomycetota bacterium]